MGKKTTRLRFARETGTEESTENQSHQRKLRYGKKAEGAKKGALRFQETAPAPEDVNGGKRARHVITAETVTRQLHRQVERENEDDNTGVQAVQCGEEVTERAARNTVERVRCRKKEQPRKNKATSEDHATRRKTAHASYPAQRTRQTVSEGGRYGRKLSASPGTAQSKRALEESMQAGSNTLSRWRQRQTIKREYAAVRAGRSVSSPAGGTRIVRAVTGRAERITNALRRMISGKKSGAKIILLLGMVLVLLVSQVQSCSAMAIGTLTTITATSWPADDVEITRADAYYTRLEARLQRDINQMERTHSNCEEFNYDIDEIGHDPVTLISYLSAKYGAFTFRQIKGELDEIFSRQYHLTEEERQENRTRTTTVHQGESLGRVVTSGYCNCALCCGIWAGGRTASGVYPTSNHTIAVDRFYPTVSLGTEIIMNGTLYKVEDTGNFNRYGVDFDIYFDDHTTAQNWGHKSFEAFYAGGNGPAVTVTASGRVNVCYVTLTTRRLEEVMESRMDAEEKELYEVYHTTKGNRVFFGTPLDCDWHRNIVGNYGYRCSGTSVQESDQLELSVPAGRKVLSVLDGTVKSVSGGRIVLEDVHGYQIRYEGCANVRVSAGAEVTKGDEIAKVGSAGNLQLSFVYRGVRFHPYFYLDVGEGSVYAENGSASPRGAALIREARRYLGTPYVWGGYGPSGFDCSGFVSYVINHSGAGWNVGRQTADGLKNRCRTVSAANAQPGDLVFFQETYPTRGASHVGIYLGNGQMIHAGHPVQVTSIHTPYWQRHLYGFRRLP